MNITFLPEFAWLFFLLFSRVGTMMMLMPGIGERLIPRPMRLAFAVSATFLFYPLVADKLPPMPDAIGSVFIVVIREVLIGLFIGLSIRLLISALQVAGNIIAFQMGLGFAMSFDPAQGSQGALVGNFLGVLGTALIFATNLHHLAIAGFVDSFTLFPAGQAFSLGDSVSFAVSMAAKSFGIAIQISAPFLIFGIIFNLGLGVLSRLMPQLQVFLIAMPASIMVGFLILAVLLSSLMTLYLGHLEEALSAFLQ